MLPSNESRTDAQGSLDYPWEGLGEATVVDIGGGVGK